MREYIVQRRIRIIVRAGKRQNRRISVKSTDRPNDKSTRGVFVGQRIWR